jgi:hypothetical protein
MKNAILTATMTLVMLSAQIIPASAKGPQIVPGTEASSRVNELTKDISWSHNLGQAEATAKKQGKMIFWVQMLGDISGAT